MPSLIFRSPPGATQPTLPPRLLASWLAAAAIAAALWERQAGAGWQAALAAQAAFWPLLARWLADRASDRQRAEQRHLLVDAGLAGLWAAAVGFNLLPCVLLLAGLLVQAVALAEPRRLPALGAACGVGVFAGLVAMPFEPHLRTGWTTLLACIPGLLVLPLSAMVSARRLTQRLQQEHEQSGRLARETLDAMQAGVVLYDPQDRLILCNDDFRQLYGPIAHHLVPGRTFEELLTQAVREGLIPQARGREQAWCAERLKAHREPGAPVLRELPGGQWRRIVERRLSDGSLLAFSTDVTDLVQRERSLQQEVAARQAVESQLREANTRLANLSGTDHLTGLANRRQLEDRLGQEWLRAARQGSPLSALMIDVDHFKAFNDQHGHLKGDACLKAIADALSGCARRAGDLLARFGGEEFVLLLPDTTAQEAARVAQQCLEAVDARALPHGAAPGGGPVTVSIGYASCVPDGSQPHARLLDLADAALYRAKRLGRHRAASSDEPAPQEPSAG